MKRKSGWRCLESNKVFEAGDGKTVFIELYQDKVITSSGKTISYARYYSSDVVVVVPFLADGRLVMINQYRYPPDKYMLEFPAGHIDEGEDPAATAHRELREETGYTASHLELVYKYHPSVSKSRQLVHVFRATGLAQGPVEHEDNETIEVMLVEPNELGRMISANQIDNAGTLVSYLLCCTGLQFARGK